jgi:hypothetical protein
LQLCKDIQVTRYPPKPDWNYNSKNL